MHADKLIDHVADRGNHPEIGSAAPKVKVDSVLDAFELDDHDRPARPRTADPEHQIPKVLRG